MKIINVAMNGLGSVNKTLSSILNDKREVLAQKYGLGFNIVMISDSSGVAYNGDGFDMNEIIIHKNTGGRVSELADFKTGNFLGIIKAADIDVVWEASPVDFETGGEALDITREALSRGISVVLANKGPVVKAQNELKAISIKTGAGFKYSATVCGGLPILNIGERDMIAGEVSEFSGVFNGTCNFILDALKNGVTLDNAVKEAQNVGAAEADPSLDIDGWDTAFKLLIIANHVMEAGISLDDIDVKGIRSITAEMIRAEESQGNTIKLVASYDGQSYKVKPIVVAKDTFIGSCIGWEMGIEIHSDLYGIMYHKLYEKEPIPTAASMLRDTVNILQGC
jgi:homoserine dehydrogenase